MNSHKVWEVTFSIAQEDMVWVVAADAAEAAEKTQKHLSADLDPGQSVTITKVEFMGDIDIL